MISRNAQRANHAAPTKTNAPAAHVTPSVNAEPKRLRWMFGPPPRLDEDESSALPLPTSVGAGVGVGGCSMTTVDWMVPCVSGSKVGGGGTLVGVGTEHAQPKLIKTGRQVGVPKPDLGVDQDHVGRGESRPGIRWIRIGPEGQLVAGEVARRGRAEDRDEARHLLAVCRRNDDGLIALRLRRAGNRHNTHRGDEQRRERAIEISLHDSPDARSTIRKCTIPPRDGQLVGHTPPAATAGGQSPIRLREVRFEYGVGARRLLEADELEYRRGAAAAFDVHLTERLDAHAV